MRMDICLRERTGYFDIGALLGPNLMAKTSSLTSRYLGRLNCFGIFDELVKVFLETNI